MKNKTILPCAAAALLVSLLCAGAQARNLKEALQEKAAEHAQQAQQAQEPQQAPLAGQADEIEKKKIPIDDLINHGKTDPHYDGLRVTMGIAYNKKCPSLARLDADTAALQNHNTALAARFNTLSTGFRLTADVLAIPSHLVVLLGGIETSLVTVQTGAKTAQGVTQLRAEAKKIETDAAALLTQVRAAKAKAVRIQAKVATPLRLSKTAAADFSIAAKGLQAMDQAILQKEPVTTAMVQYALEVSNDPQKTCIQQKADQLAPELSKVALELDRVERLLLYSPDLPELKLLNGFADAVNALDKLRRDAEALENRLEDLERPLKKIEDALEDTFSVNLPYPGGSYKIKISGKKLLDASADIQEEIKAKLSDTLWEIAKAFGLNKLIDDTKRIYHTRITAEATRKKNAEGETTN